MRPIPKKDKAVLQDLDQKCAKCGSNKVEWHHPFIYAGKQITDWWATVFACKNCHAKATPHNNKYNLETREFFEYLVLKQNLVKIMMKYPKKAWNQLFLYLNKKYATHI